MKLKTILIIMCLSVSTIPLGLIVGTQGFNSSILFLLLIFVVTFCFSLLISHMITRPIIGLTKNLDSISKGQLDVKLDKSEIHEINNLTDSLNRIMASLKLAIHKIGVKKGELFEDVSKKTVEKKQEDILNSINGWSWVTDSKGEYTYCSENVFDYLGFHPEEIIGKNIFDFMLSEDAKKLKQAFNEAGKKKKQIKYLDNWNIQKNGNKICLETNAFAFFDESGKILGYKGINTDVTREKLAQQRIKDLNKELSDLKIKITELSNNREKGKSNLLETISFNKEKLDEKWAEHELDSVYIFDINANILDCNENMYKRLGYSKNELLSLNMADFDALETKQELSKKINTAKKNGAYSFKTIHKKKDGSSILVFENLQYMKDKNTFKCIVREEYSLKKTQR